MPVISETSHPLGLNFANQRKLVIRRDVHGESFSDVALLLKNNSGGAPTPQLCSRYYRDFNKKTGRHRGGYAKSGRKPWKVTKQIETFLVSRLRALRRRCICTSTTLQGEVARVKKVQLEASTIRRALSKNGYKWLPRAQKRKYSAEDMEKRKKFAEAVLRLSARALRERLAISMDGVVLSMPPPGPIDRANYCRHGDTHMWRKPSERAQPELAGEAAYGEQVPAARVIPLWGGLSEGGFAIIAVHKRRKLTAAEFVGLVKAGKMRDAIRSLKPPSRAGPWEALCDNESFLKAHERETFPPLETLRKCNIIVGHVHFLKVYLIPMVYLSGLPFCSLEARDTKRALAAHKITTWHIPPRSPDLNPVERFWGWLRKELRRMDLIDLQKKRRPLGRAAYTARIRSVCRSKRARVAAVNMAKGLKKVCRMVKKKRGAASGF